MIQTEGKIFMVLLSTHVSYNTVFSSESKGLNKKNNRSFVIPDKYKF